MVKPIPSRRERGLRKLDRDEYGEHYQETNTDYLNKHAVEEYPPPLGDVHLHLIYARSVHWRVVERGSSVCKVPGRCHLVTLVRRQTDVQS
ncbi:hypothetical protein LCGC14_0665380 [marine sediment metagenome]|uniref:Uncharacterized protein n=1 Tax=marine sediment metagenome TaxID=412755 RepID=A0A0F9RCI7_9ZZZZ